MAKRIDLRFEDNVAFIEFTNGKNEFTHEYLDDLNQALDTVLSHPSAEVLVTYGTGKHYSNGIDLVTLGAEGVHSSMLFMKKLAEFLARLTLFPMPTVAAVNGHAYAGGCIMALCHDYKVMNGDKGWMCLPEVNMPQLFPKTLLEIILAKVPVGNPRRDMITMGKRLTGPEALAAGVIDRAAPADSLLPLAVSLAKQLVVSGAYGREAMSDMKHDTYSDVVNSLEEKNFGFMTSYMLKSNY